MSRDYFCTRPGRRDSQIASRSSRSKRLSRDSRGGPLTYRVAIERLEDRWALHGAHVGNLGEISPAWFADAGHSTPSALIASPSPLPAEGAAPSETEASLHRWIVQLTASASATYTTPAAVAERFAATGLDFESLRGLGAVGLVALTARSSNESVHARFSQDPLIEHFEPDRVITGQRVPNDSRFVEQWNLRNTTQSGGTAGADISAVDAWDITTGSSDVVVAVIDSGIDYNHSDLAANIWINPGEVPGNGDDDDHNGYVDDIRGWDFANGDNNPIDDFGHGTAVAGVIAAVGNNGAGIAGVSWSAKLMNLKYLASSNLGRNEHAIAAINYVTMMKQHFGVNVRVINASWGLDSGSSDVMRDVIAAAGKQEILFVAAAGNGNVLGRGIDINVDHDPFFPASYDLDNILSVAATDDRDALARFSNYGSEAVDIAAPGVGILSTIRGGDGHGIHNGTSFAAPHVSGVAALLFGEMPYASVDEIRETILDSGDPLASLQGRLVSEKRLNAHAALLIDRVAPRAELVTAPNITQVGATPQPIEIRYFDNKAIVAASLDAADVFVKRTRDGRTFSVSLSTPAAANNANLSARYLMAPPDLMGWDPLHNGEYEIHVAANQVRDTATPAHHVASEKLGTFLVDIQVGGFFTVNSQADTPDRLLRDGKAEDADGLTTLRAAIMEASALAPLPTTVFLLPGEYTLAISGAGEDGGATGDLDLATLSNVKLIGTNTATTIIDAAGLDRVLDIKPGATLRIEGLTIRRGQAGSGSGGGILNAGTLELTEVAVLNNSAASGGGIYNTGAAGLLRSTVANNTATGDGGGVFNPEKPTDSPMLVIDSSTLSGNSATNGGGIYHADGPNAAGSAATLRIINSTLSGNSASQYGGGLYTTATATAEVASTTITLNSAGGNSVANGLVGWWRGENNGHDEAGSNPATLFGTTAYAPGLFGDAFRVGTATGARVEIPGLAAMQHPQFTFQAWVKSEEVVTADDQGGVIVSKDAAFFVSGPGTSGQFYFLVPLRRGTSFLELGDEPWSDPDTRYGQQEFHHVALTWDGANVRGYVNGNLVVHYGVLENLDENPDNDWHLDYDPTGPLTLGAFDNNVRRFRGLIDEPAIFSRALTRAEIVDSYQLGLPFLLAGGGGIHRAREGQEVIAWWRAENDLTDSVGPHHGSVPIPVEVQFANGRLAGSRAFNFNPTVNSLVEVPHSPSFVLDQFSVEAWIFADNGGSSDDGRGGIVVSKNNLARREDTVRSTFRIYGPGPGQNTLDGIEEIRFAIGLSTGSDSLELVRPFGMSPSVAYGGWRHVAMTWDGRTLSSYFDGVLLESFTVTNNTDTDPSNDLYLDYNPSWPFTLGGAKTATNRMDGRIDEAALYGRALTAQEVQQLVAGISTLKSAARLGALSLKNTIVAGNVGTGHPDVAGDFASLGHNLIGSRGMAAGFIATDLVGGTGTAKMDPLLGPLADNGGPTRTHAILFLSPAIDAVRGSTAPAVDQRGVFRPQNATGELADYVDIGSVERDRGEIRGRLFGDLNGDSLFNANEVGLSQWTVYLDIDANGVLSTGEPTALTRDDDPATPTVDERGIYSFNQLAGTYRVRVQPRPWVGTIPVSGEYVVNLSTGGHHSNVNFGFRPLPGEIRGRVFNDLDEDGLVDPGEPGLVGWTVYLDDDNNDRLDSGERFATTDAEGRYVFDNLEPLRDYVIRQVSRPLIPQTAPQLDSTHTRRWVLHVMPGQHYVDVIFGNLDLGPPVSEFGNISGRFFRDDNGNGLQESPDEPGLPGLTVYLDVNDNRQFDAGEASDLTDSEGVYILPATFGDVHVVRAVLGPQARQIAPLGNQFIASTSLSVGFRLQAVVAADFNGDLFDDLAVVDGHSNQVQILINNGNGTFSTSQLHRVGSLPVAIVAGHFVGNDSLIDLIVSNANNGGLRAITILRNTGGTFEVAHGPAVSGERPQPGAIAAIDFNRDGQLDIALADENQAWVHLLRNNADGTFSHVQTLTGAGDNPLAIVAGQLNDDNGDGVRDSGDRADFAVAAYGPAGQPQLSSVTVWLDNGSGFTATSPSYTGVGNGAYGMTLADVEQDGDLDLVVVNLDSNNARILTNNGDGVFTVASDGLATGVGPTSITARDMDGDQDTDLIIANATSRDASLLRNDGLGSFSLPENFGALNHQTPVAIALAVGRFNNDTAPDVALAHGALGTMAVTLNNVVPGSQRVALQISQPNVSGFNFALQFIDPPPTIDTPAHQHVSEDASRQCVDLTGVSAGLGEDQPLRIIPEVDLPNLFTSLEIEPAIATTPWRVCYQPAQDASGQAKITLTVEDSGVDGNLQTLPDNKLASVHFMIDVMPVNDPPTLDAVAAPPSINENDGLQTVNISGITAGGGEAQPLVATARVVTESQVGLITQLSVTNVSLGGVASLTYTPGPDRFGAATIEVTVTDGGLDGDLVTMGDNGAVQRNFSVTVTSKYDELIAVGDEFMIPPGSMQVALDVLTNDHIDAQFRSVARVDGILNISAGGHVEISPTDPTRVVYTPAAGRLPGSVETFRYLVTDTVDEATATVRVVISGSMPAAVVGRHIFYNNSAFDTVSDDGAIAPDKSALLPGQTATSANYTNYHLGINGLMVDVEGLTNPSALGIADFEFRAGTTGDPAQWPLVPGATVSARVGAGTNGSHRVAVTFPDGSIRNKWLRVVLKSNNNTGLGADDVHFWGNAVGETGNLANDTRVDFADIAEIRRNQGPAALDNPADINRDGFVNALDETSLQANALAGDLNHDDHVDLVDVALMQTRLGSVAAIDALWDAYWGDLNGDGAIGRADAAEIARHLGRQATPEMVGSRLSLLAAPPLSAPIAQPAAAPAPAALVVQAARPRRDPARAIAAVFAQHESAVLSGDRNRIDRISSRGHREDPLSAAPIVGKPLDSAMLRARRTRGRSSIHQ
jgi:subtilisin family serine protease